MAAIDFNQVSKAGNTDKPLLRNIDLHIQAGEVVALIGGNGAGKTTLIKAMLDLVDIDAGDIHINKLSHRLTEARAGVAYLPERFKPPYYLSGRGFLENMVRLSGTVTDETRVADLCAHLDLEIDALSHTIRRYSKGMGQKLGLIAALLCGEKVLVLDEPMSGLDAKARILLKSELLSLRELGRTVFFSTHLLADLEQLCDRVAVLHEGQLRYVGSVSAFCSDYRATTAEQAYLACIDVT